MTSRKAGIDRDIVSGLARPPDAWATLGAPGAELVRVGDELTLKQFDDRIAALSDTQRRHLRIELPGPDPTDGRRILGYPAFGLYILRTSRVYLAVRCGPTGQNGRGGHDHNDQLALELMVDGKDWIRDPGTYVYTAAPAIRNAYRSATAHFAPQLEGPEPALLDLGLFRLGPGSVATCLYWGEAGFAGRLRTVDSRVANCRIVLTDAAIEVTHAVEGGRLLDAGETDWRALRPDIAYSPGYGIVER